MIALVPGTELLDINAGDMLFVSIWALLSLIMAAIYVYKMLQ